MSARKPHRHEIKAFAAFQGKTLVYATIKPTEADAQAALKRLNPPVEGFPYPFQVLPVFIGVDGGFQYDLINPESSS